MRTSVCLSTFVALGGLLREHGSLRDVRVGNAANLRHEARAPGSGSRRSPAGCRGRTAPRPDRCPRPGRSIQPRASHAPTSTASTSPSPTSQGQSERPRLGGSYFGGPPADRSASPRSGRGRARRRAPSSPLLRSRRRPGRRARRSRGRRPSRPRTGSGRPAPSRAPGRRRGRGRAGTSGRSSDGAGGTSARCFIAISTGLSPVNGTSPVRSSKSTIPVE